MKYENARLLVKNGDIVFFSSHNGFGDKVIKWWSSLVIKGLRSANYSHIGMAYWLGSRLMLLEASFKGGVRIVPMSARQPDVVVQMGFSWTDAADDVAFKHIGKKYGLWDAIAAGLGMRSDRDEEFICTEYVAVVAEALSYIFPRCKQLPDAFYDQTVSESKPILIIDNPTSTI